MLGYDGDGDGRGHGDGDANNHDDVVVVTFWDTSPKELNLGGKKLHSEGFLGQKRYENR